MSAILDFWLAEGLYSNAYDTTLLPPAADP